MRRGRILLTAPTVLASAALFNAGHAQTAAPTDAATPTPDNAVMLTVLMKHDQSRPLAERNAQLEKQGAVASGAGLPHHKHVAARLERLAASEAAACEERSRRIHAA
jgi:hypothetical protein